MNRTLTNPRSVLRTLIELLDIPPSYYEKAAKRHRSLGEWFCRPESLIAKYAPAVYPQGSFRLGTVIRPLLSGEEYDLDTVCELQKLTKLVLTQRQLKEAVGHEVKMYAAARNIKEPVIERNRCWRLEYADEVQFHIDILPCLPEDVDMINRLVAAGVEPNLAMLATALTCKSDPRYELHTSDWPTTNPSGYALWFEGRMRLEALSKRKQLVAEGRYASVDDVPTYALKTPLQRAIQFLKRHRDVMFRDDCELKPTSMLITTLAAQAYEGEGDVEQAIEGILARMPYHVRATCPRVPNPTNLGEDFADKWAADPELEQNFGLWHSQAVRDFGALRDVRDPSRLRRLTEERLSLSLSENEARSLTSTPSPLIAVAAPAVHIQQAAKPWGKKVR